MVAEMLGPRAAAVFDRAVMHVPIETAREARDLARKHLAHDNGAPLALKSLGVFEKNMDKACEIAFQNQYPNPRPIERGALRQLLQNAWRGVRP
jgi:alcohol dehydrogenase class IV